MLKEVQKLKKLVMEGSQWTAGEKKNVEGHAASQGLNTIGWHGSEHLAVSSSFPSRLYSGYPDGSGYRRISTDELAEIAHKKSKKARNASARAVTKDRHFQASDLHRDAYRVHDAIAKAFADEGDTQKSDEYKNRADAHIDQAHAHETWAETSPT